MKWMFLFVCEKVSNSNLFIPDENAYDEQVEDAIIAIQHKKSRRRLYILLMLISMYVLFYGSIMTSQSHLTIIYEIDVNKFEKLSSEYGERLSCPRSTIQIPYEKLVSNSIRFDSVCRSLFVSQQWIDGLYRSNRTSYGIGDFRRTANSQVYKFSFFCSFSICDRMLCV